MSTIRNVAVLAKETESTAAAVVVPGVTGLFNQMEAVLSSLIVRLISFPVCIAHSVVCEIGIGLSVVDCHFPYKLGPGFWVYTVACCPYVPDTTTIIASLQHALCIIDMHFITTN